MLAVTPVIVKAKIPPRKGGIPHSLKNTQKKGSLSIPGFHRTKTESVAAAIILKTIKTGKSGLYGPGFYMTRTYTRQMSSRMIKFYGQHLVRCKVNIEGFICFDQAVAKRVWGKHHTLKDQLVHYKPWDIFEEKMINELSTDLSDFWKYKKGFSAEIAKKACDKLYMIRGKTPGIIYTGSRDGACVLAYKTDVVTPLSIAHIPSRQSVHRVSWFTTETKDLVRRYDPESALKEDVSTLIVALRKLKKTKDIEKNIRSLYAEVSGFYEKLTFILALEKTFKPLHDNLIEDMVSSLIDHFSFKLPSIKYTSNNDAAFDGLYNKIDFEGWSFILRRRKIVDSVRRVCIQRAVLKNQESFEKLQKRLRYVSTEKNIYRALYVFFGLKGLGFKYSSIRKAYFRHDGVEMLHGITHGKIGITGLTRYWSSSSVYPSFLWKKSDFEKALKKQWLEFYATLKEQKDLKNKAVVFRCLDNWWAHYGQRYTAELVSQENFS